MKDFENDLIYYPNPDPVKEPRFILKSVDELEKSTKYSVTCNGTERVVYCLQIRLTMFGSSR
ncbi:hypothetical protein [Hominenteromicrobium sp.]|uniref:hypothetical protein n=1 Tax=Hominenteromicrobium sp. TaxID=3073581 RepID=UPI00399B3A17